MSAPVSSLHLVGDGQGSRARAVMAAWEQLRPGGAIRRSVDLVTATAAPTEQLEVIVLLAPAAEGVTHALGTLDPRALPRWAVVPGSPEEAFSAEFASEEWAVPMLVHRLRSAVTLLALRRDNARLRGDLKTVARRLGHDLRTPLISISAANEALAEAPGLPGNGAASYRESINTAVTDAGRLLERVGAVLMASARPVACQPVEMEDVVWGARQTLDTRIRSAGATIVAPEKWPVVTGVPALLQLVWTNLLSNSLDHGGKAPRISIGWERGAAHTRFWIRDNGPGVDHAKRAQLFHSFDRLHELNAPRHYGLSVVHRLVELQAGTTGYDADPKPGGTFFFTLP